MRKIKQKKTVGQEDKRRAKQGGGAMTRKKFKRGRKKVKLCGDTASIIAGC